MEYAFKTNVRMSGPEEEKKLKPTAEQISHVMGGCFEVEGKLRKWDWRSVDFVWFPEGQQKFHRVFTSELSGGEGGKFRSALMGDDIQRSREFFLNQLARAWFDVTLLGHPYPRSRTREEKFQKKMTRAIFYSSLGTMLGLVTASEVSELMDPSPRKKWSLGGVKVDEKKFHLAREKVQEMLVFQQPRQAFSSPDDTRKKIDRIKDEVRFVGKGFTYCFFPGTFRIFHPMHSLLGVALKGLVDGIVWGIADDEAYSRLVDEGAKRRKPFYAIDTLRSITSVPCFGPYDDIVLTSRLVQEGTRAYTEEINVCGRFDYVYVGSKDDPLYFSRVRAVIEAGKKVISGPNLQLHSSDIERKYLQILDILQRQGLSSSQVRNQFPHLARWTGRF